MKKNKIAQIIPIMRLKRDLHYFDYLIPDDLSPSVKIGQLVEIPFRNGLIKGAVFNLVASSEFKKLKSIHKIITPLPLLTAWQLKLVKDLSNLYFVSMSVFIKMLIPNIPQKIRLSQNKFLKDLNFSHPLKTELNVNKYYIELKPVLLRYFNYKNIILTYLGLIKKVLHNKKQVLIIVPQLTDIKKIYQYLENYQNVISVFLNDLPKNKYWSEWLRIKNGHAQIIIGTRSAIFAPFKNLDLIIIDQEDNENHKQEEPNPRYHVKTVALKIRQLLNCKIILTAFTPSFKSLYKVTQKEWQYFEVDKLKGKPEITIVNRANEFKKGNFSIFSDVLEEKITENLKQKKQIFLFLNRRGMATLVNCKDCGYIANCPTCNLPLTYHVSKELICHYCGYKKSLFLFCPQCQSPSIKIAGTGIEKAEIEIKKIYPQAKILKLDTETLLKNNKISNYDIIIGTQYAFDFIDWQKISLIGVLNADTLFYLPDYRSLEKTFNLLAKLLLFIADNNKELIVQTFSPENYIFKALKTLDYKLFYQHELVERKDLHYPPLSRLVKLIYQSIEFNAGQYEITKVYKDLISKVEENKVIINPPLLVHTQQVRGRWRWQIIIKFLDIKSSLDFLQDLPEDIIIDPEPENIL